MVETEHEQEKATPGDVLGTIVEPRRKRGRISLREAANRAGMSEATWRQLVNGGVNQSGKFLTRHPRVDQVLDMANAVECLDEAAAALGARQDEVYDSRRRVIHMDPAEEEIMSLRHLGALEKLRLLDALHTMRETLNKS